MSGASMSNIIPLRNTGGFTRMDNELYEALIGAELSGRELRVALAIHRQTAGYNLESARIAASYIAQMSGIHREDVSRAICELIRQRVIYRVGGSRSPIGFAPVNEWAIDEKNTHKAKQKVMPQCGVSTTSNVAFLPHNKDINTNLTANAVVAAVASTNPVLESDAEQQVTTNPDQPEASKAERIPYDRIVAIYNEVCGEKLPKCIKLTNKRRTQIKGCWNLEFNGKYPFRKGEFWSAYFTDCLTNKHWTGENDRGWTADIEFLTKQDKVLKVLEAL